MTELIKKRKLQIVMPMAGLGSRFQNAGFTTPKPLIPVDGMPMFLKAISSINEIDAEKTFYFVIRKEHVDKQNLDKLIKSKMPNAELLIIPEMTNGAVETAYAVKDNINLNDALIVMDCDLWFKSIEFDAMVDASISDIDDISGGLLTFKSDNPRYSYAKVDNSSIVLETAEKIVISDRAITGAYFFATGKDFIEASEKLLSQSISEKIPEYYLSLLYNILIDEGKRIKAVSVKEFASFGTPEELEKYNSSKK
jgi:dTDP-glucose pyrophosphorylase